MDARKWTLITAIALLGVLAGCTSETDAQRVLTDQGYVDIRFTGYRAFICGDDYTFHTGFEADTNVITVDKDGKQAIVKHHVTGAVCSGWLKGNSIKLD
jgi:hypothetical protein